MEGRWIIILSHKEKLKVYLCSTFSPSLIIYSRTHLNRHLSKSFWCFSSSASTNSLSLWQKQPHKMWPAHDYLRLENPAEWYFFPHQPTNLFFICLGPDISTIHWTQVVLSGQWHNKDVLFNNLLWSVCANLGLTDVEQISVEEFYYVWCVKVKAGCSLEGANPMQTFAFRF